VDHAEEQVSAARLAGADGTVDPSVATSAAVRAEPAAPSGVKPAPGAWARFFDGDVWFSFRHSPVAIGSSAVALVCIVCALFAGWVAPHNPFDLATLELSDSMLPPSWMQGGAVKYLLGTDEQGRDVLSALMYGARISLLIGVASVVASVLIGVSLGLLSGYVGGRVDAFIMRVCDVMLSFPSILIALLIAGVGHAMFPNARDTLAFGVLIIAIALPGWVQYARTVRGSTMVERHKEYVQAARVIGVSPMRIMLRHVLPNVLGPVLVLATIHVALAIQTEATLSFLGVGVSPTSPSLGTFINDGQKQLFSGAWWLVVFPGTMLLLISLSMNLFGDWLRDALNPRLR
jgi:peptide/nickel transport system permease protein